VNDKHWVDVRIPSDKVTDLRNGTLVPSDKLREMQERLARLEAVAEAAGTFAYCQETGNTKQLCGACYGCRLIAALSPHGGDGE
jgi:hypothetical protein